MNDALAIKEADIGVAMNSGAAATKAVARLVLLDGKFSHLPSVVAEGRQVIANIERVSMLFLTKTAYATFLAIAFGILLLPFPFLPRQLSVTDGLTIGIPAFFLALLPNAQRYIPGFLRRSLTFAVPAGVAVTLGLAAYARLAANLQIPEAEIRTGSTLILAIIGMWILVVLSRPVTRFKGMVIGAMMIGLVLVYSVPDRAGLPAVHRSDAPHSAADPGHVSGLHRAGGDGALRPPARRLQGRPRSCFITARSSAVRVRPQRHHARQHVAMDWLITADQSPSAATRRSSTANARPRSMTAVAPWRAALLPRATPDANPMTRRPNNTMPAPSRVMGNVTPWDCASGVYRRKIVRIPRRIWVMPAMYISTTANVTVPGRCERSPRHHGVIPVMVRA